MIFQDNKNNLEVIQKVGCFFCCACELAELVTTKNLTSEILNKLWNESKKLGIIDGDNRLVACQDLATLSLRELGDEGKFIEIATFEQGQFNWYKWVKRNLKNKKLYFIQKIKTNENEIGTHFRIVDKKGFVLYDPYSKGVKCEKVFYSVVLCYDK